MNHFFALPLPPPVQETVADFAYFWKTYTGTQDAGRWYEAADYHLTLKFLGNIPDAEAVRLSAAGDAVAARHALLTLTLTTPSAFPNIFRPNVLFLGVKSTSALRDLVTDVGETMETLGVPRETRLYAPHITVARVKASAATNQNWRTHHEQAFVKWEADTLAFMQTLPPELRANENGARYNSMELFPFAGRAE